MTSIAKSACAHGKTVIVTGAARGIGLAVCERLAGESANVLMVDSDAECLERQCARLAASGYTVAACVADVTDPEQVETMVSSALSRFSRLDVLVNNAGITGPAKESWQYSLDEWNRVVAVDLTGVFLCSAAAVRAMLEQQAGRIVNIASIAGKEGNPNMSAYTAAKAGVIGFTKALAKEVATHNIYVNCVTPAVIETEILDQLNKETVDYMVSRIPLARTGRPDEVANLVAWIASEECSFSTGAVFDISGGRATY